MKILSTSLLISFVVDSEIVTIVTHLDQIQIWIFHYLLIGASKYIKRSFLEILIKKLIFHYYLYVIVEKAI